MEDNSFLQNFGNDDVVCSASTMFKVIKLKEAMKKAFRGSVQIALNEVLKSEEIEINKKFYDSNQRSNRTKDWLSEGVDCEILKIGAKGWKKGKLRISVSLDFCPDEPDVEETLGNNQPEINQTESPLDDIRQMINENSQPHGN